MSFLGSHAKDLPPKAGSRVLFASARVISWKDGVILAVNLVQSIHLFDVALDRSKYTMPRFALPPRISAD